MAILAKRRGGKRRGSSVGVGAEAAVGGQGGSPAVPTGSTDPTDRRAVCVVDFETRLGEAAALVPGNPSMARAMLHRIAAVSILEFEMTPVGLEHLTLTSFVEPADEREMLMAVEAALSRLGPDGVPVTHNGTSYDARLALRRCMSLWLFEMPAIMDWAEDPSRRHFDTMLRFGGRAVGMPGGSLVDLCAGLGIPATVPAASVRHPIDARIRKGQVDVCATALAFLHWEAAKRRSPSWLTAAWRDLGRYLIQPSVRADHLMPMARRGLEIGDAVSLG